MRSRLKSDVDHYETKVMRRNLVELFLENQDTNKYITTHLFGVLNASYDDFDLDKLENLCL